MIRPAVLGALLLAALSSPAAGQAFYGARLGLGYTRAPVKGDTYRFETGSGGAFWVRGRLALALDWAQGTVKIPTTTFYPGWPATPGYYWDSSVDRCRSSSTGRFADSGLCGVASLTVDGVDYHTFNHVSAEAAYVIWQRSDGRGLVTVGGGFASQDDGAIPFAAATVYVPILYSPDLDLGSIGAAAQIQAGREYVGITGTMILTLGCHRCSASK